MYNIDFNNVTVFQNNRPVLHDFSMHFRPGEMAFVIGKTGTGKTSLLKSLYAELAVKGRKAMVCGIDVLKLKQSKRYLLRRKIGMVFQDFQLIKELSVEENLLFVLKATGWKDVNKMRLRIEEVLDKVGLMGFDKEMPYRLSGGEQQRVVIARAILNTPELILADEPTANLDPETADNILQLLTNISKENNSTLLIATHNYGIVSQYSARILRTLNGQLYEEHGLEM